ncbi:MAG: DUF1957 domain-containing protein [Cyanobacteria bacterium HKST-UBA04]|nr:DUF1957 domain-containing protein [Cyanobacteria bacterium HKST-UBA04]MCA9840517.1 DUF1957 domain-containing protein [Cyanobacteria bacterium HKST-UBA03]
MSVGQVVLMLHSHLPYYRKHGMWPFGEENLYECMAETYIPLLDALYELRDEGIKPGITVGITPILAEQLADAHLQQGFLEFLDARIKAADEDLQRYPNDTLRSHSEHVAFLAQWYKDYYQNIRNSFEHKYNHHLLPFFKQLQDEGAIEIVTCAATHGFLPLLGQDEAVDFQIKVGVETYKQHFDRAPKGIWLPECAYRPAIPANSYRLLNGGTHPPRAGIDAFLHAHGIEYFFTEFHAIEGSERSDSRRAFGAYSSISQVPMQVQGKTGLTTYQPYFLKDYPVAVMGRCERASFQVWSADHGYPGDGLYREFHKKDTESGLHYWRLTSKDSDLGAKMLYDPVLAFEQTKSHADHYVGLLSGLLGHYDYEHGEPGMIMISYDTELFGHWWFEGVSFLKHLIRGIHQHPTLTTNTASVALKAQPPKQAIELPESTWGAGGHYHVWANDDVTWTWTYIHQAEAKLFELAGTLDVPNLSPDAATTLNVAARQLLLLEGSDWPFLMTTGQAHDYAIERFNEHKDNFWALTEMLDTNQFDMSQVHAIAEQDNCFDFVRNDWLTEWQRGRKQAIDQTEPFKHLRPIKIATNHTL